ncbi:MAG: hypothetical protein R2845_10715 [Thermomicrobiales bacterium]
MIDAHGIEVIQAGPDAVGALDAIFPYDPSIITNAGAILLRPGKRQRLDEVRFAEATYFDLGIPIAGRISAPGCVEGGDTMWIDEHTLAVGRTYRTNAEESANSPRSSLRKASRSSPTTSRTSTDRANACICFHSSARSLKKRRSCTRR